MERRDTLGRCFEINRKAMPDGGLVITITDVTDARTAEAALAQAHRLQEATLASMDQGFAAYGADGVLLACNERHRELLGASAGRSASASPPSPTWC
jgi:PAS domain-containing protein